MIFVLTDGSSSFVYSLCVYSHSLMDGEICQWSNEIVSYHTIHHLQTSPLMGGFFIVHFHMSVYWNTIGPEYDVSKSTLIFPHVSDAVGSWMPITWWSITGVEGYWARQLPTLMVPWEHFLFLPRTVDPSILQLFAAITWNSHEDMIRRLNLYSDRFVELTSTARSCTSRPIFVPFMYDWDSAVLGDCLHDNGQILAPNYQNTYLVKRMNDKFLAKRAWSEKHMTVQWHFVALTHNDAYDQLKKYADDHPTWFAMKTAMSFSGVWVALYKQQEDWTMWIKVENKIYSLEKFYNIFLKPKQDQFKEILCEPLLPIEEKNVWSVQLYVDKQGDIYPYKATMQKMQWSAHTWNSLVIELTNLILANQMKRVAVKYYRVLADALKQDWAQPYVWDAAIDIALLDLEHISLEQLRSYWFTEIDPDCLYTNSEWKQYLIYVLENNSRYGGATTVAKTDVMFRETWLLPDDAYLNVQNFSLHWSNKPQRAQSIPILEHDLMKVLQSGWLSYNTKTGIWVVSVSLVSPEKAVIIYGMQREWDCAIASRIADALRS